jgi:hypothetical protein
LTKPCATASTLMPPSPTTPSTTTSSRGVVFV